MKKLVLVLSLTVGILSYGHIDTEKINKKTTTSTVDSKKDVEKVIMTQLNASAARDVEKMKTVLHNDFRIVVNQAERLTVLNLETMLALYKQGKFGGEEKEISIVAIDVQGNLTAMAKVTEKGKKAIFNIYFSLINIKGEWKIVEEVAYLDYL